MRKFWNSSSETAGDDDSKVALLHLSKDLEFLWDFDLSYRVATIATLVECTVVYSVLQLLT